MENAGVYCSDLEILTVEWILSVLYK